MKFISKEIDFDATTASTLDTINDSGDLRDMCGEIVTPEGTSWQTAG